MESFSCNISLIDITLELQAIDFSKVFTRIYFSKNKYSHWEQHVDFFLLLSF